MSDNKRVLLVGRCSDFPQANGIVFDASGFEVFKVSSDVEGLNAVEKENLTLVPV